MILGDKILYYLYGASFVEGTSALYFLLIVQVVNVFMFLGTMSLTAINRQIDAFWVTIIAASANIILDVALIPIIGITGAAVATLIAITLNAIGALLLLSKVISVKFEYGQVKNILYSAVLMGLLVLFIRILLPLSNVIAVIAVIIFGALIYILVLFKLDRKICNELKDLIVNLGFPWPKWL